MRIEPSRKPSNHSAKPLSYYAMFLKRLTLLKYIGFINALDLSDAQSSSFLIPITLIKAGNAGLFLIAHRSSLLLSSFSHYLETQQDEHDC